MFFNRVAIAWHNLAANKFKLLLSVFGIAFAVVLMFVEIGFYYAFYDSAAFLTRRLNADLIMVSPHRQAVIGNHAFPRERLYQARMLAEVVDVYPVYTNNAFWRNPDSHQRHWIRIIGLDPLLPALNIEEISAYQFQLQLPDTLLADKRSKPEFGQFYPGLETELAETKFRVIDTFALGSDFINHGTLIMSDKNFAKLFWPAHSLDKVSLGLLKTAASANLQTLKKKLAEQLPGDIQMYTKEEFVAVEKEYWRKLSPLGTLFLTGVFAGFVTGLFVCYQVLNSEVLSYLREFATLKAMGYTNRDIANIVLQQSLFLSVLGFAVGLTASKQVCDLIARNAQMPIAWDASLAFITFALTVAMCVIAGIGASLKVMDADPAELF